MKTIWCEIVDFLHWLVVPAMIVSLVIFLTPPVIRLAQWYFALWGLQ